MIENRTEPPVAQDDARMAQMREANQNLLIAAVHAQETAEVAERSSRDKEEFLAMLAHELRNPLAPMTAALAILHRLTDADPRLPWVHDVLKRQVDHMTRLLDDLLEVSRISGGRLILRMRPVEASEFMLAAVEASRPLIVSRSQKLTVELPVERLTVSGDPTRLTQTFANLLNNASKYTPEGGAIAFSAERQGESVALRVSDNGIGIAREALPRVFDLFTQEGRSLDRSQGGLGIGLTVVRNLVEQHGGTVEARSPGMGLGSDFVVTLPLLHGTPAPPLAAATGEVQVPGKRHRIVIIEDNVDANDSLKVVMEMMGHEVLPAFDGVAGVALVRETRPDFVLCDMGLPGLDGYGVIARLKETMDTMPVMIALTGYGQAKDRIKALGAGFDHHVIKPVDIEALLRLIASQPKG